MVVRDVCIAALPPWSWGGIPETKSTPIWYAEMSFLVGGPLEFLDNRAEGTELKRREKTRCAFHTAAKTSPERPNQVKNVSFARDRVIRYFRGNCMNVRG